MHPCSLKPLKCEWLASKIGEFMSVTTSNIKADAKFLRRVLVGLVSLTVMSGAVVGFSAVHAMTAQASQVSGQ